MLPAPLLRRLTVLGPTARTLRTLRRRAARAPRHEPGVARLPGLVVHHVDLLSVYMEYKDIFVAGIYDFEATSPAPRIIDGGGYIGMSALFFKQRHPGAEVITFEPDPQLAALIRTNVAANGMSGVTVVEAGLAAQDGTAAFDSDLADGGRIGSGAQTIETVRLSRWLTEPVDFLKLNIEGLELDVLQEAEPHLGNVRELVLEYHGWPGGEQRLGPILDLLDRAGFRYLVNHTDYETNAAVRPPFRDPGGSPWFALVHGRRLA